MAEIIPIPALTDNYIWLIKSTPSHVVVIDPGVAEPVLSYLKDHKLKLGCILITHHHWDHTNGIAELIQQFPDCLVFGPRNEKVPHTKYPVAEGDRVLVPELNLDMHVLDIPGHTLGHIAYYDEGSLFCGDTLFLCGCGRLFEGTAEQMHSSLNKLKALPDDLNVYCAHEYTQANLEFCLSVEPDNESLQQRMEQVKHLRQAGKPTIPVPLKIEKRCNPFLRCDEALVAQRVLAHTGKEDDSPISIFTQLRAWKDNF